MIISGAFDFVDVLNKAADATWKREEVLNNNIANVDTPSYKREDITFASYLEAELKQAAGGAKNKSIAQTIKDVNLNNLTYTVYKDYQGMSYRLDGNNVDIDTENVELAANQLMYNGLIDSMSSEFSRIKTAIGK